MLQLIRSYFRRNEGAAAIEFSILVLPYIIISLGIIELSLMMTSASLLESATDRASRQIRTGQLQQSGGDPEEQFRNSLCAAAVVLIRCEDIMVEAIEMNSYADFQEATFDEDGNMVSSGFDPGGSNSKILIRVGFQYQMITPLVGPLLNGEDGSTLFISTIVLQTEPYEFQGGA